MTPSYALTVIVLQGWWLTSGSNSMRLPMRLASTPKDTQSLKQDELVKTRQITKSEAGVVTGTVHAIATGGLTVLHPIYAGRAGDSAKLKLDIIQTELMKRGVPLHQRDEADNDAVEGGMDFGPVAVDLAPGEVLEDSVAEWTDKLPPQVCKRLRSEKFHRLRCMDVADISIRLSPSICVSLSPYGTEKTLADGNRLLPMKRHF
ncbi:MAG: hypothetical protein LQ340_000948 [Diploschistes diacapsis]|nr:MAG: hypothetical protein LQ340_000948 [Diploschistes diacapsis]